MNVQCVATKFPTISDRAYVGRLLRPLCADCAKNHGHLRSQSFIIGKMLLADRGFAVTKLAGRSGFEDVQRGEKHGNLRKA